MFFNKNIWRDNETPLEKGWARDERQYTADFLNALKVLRIKCDIKEINSKYSSIFYEGTLPLKIDNYEIVPTSKLKIVALKEHYEKSGYKMAIRLNGLKFLDFPELPVLAGDATYRGATTYNLPIEDKSIINWILSHKDKFMAQYKKDLNIWWSLKILNIV